MFTETIRNEIPSASQEREILNRLVDAIMDVQEDLCDAQPDEWTAILRAACRRQKIEQDQHGCDELAVLC